MSEKPTQPGVADNPLVDRYLDAVWLEKGLSANTLSAYRRDLEALAHWLTGGGQRLEQADGALLGDYLAYRLGEKLSARSTRRAMSSIRGFYRYLVRERLIDSDPTALLDNPKVGRALPRSLGEEDVEKLLAAPGGDSPLELRDKAMLEV
ncbi:MAG TPA: site-specific integrase, partial [Pseudomonadaceae bacterium]|nr:site-specific integrase [Pseudomonadaceae bacterium]